MKTIYKYPVRVSDNFSVALPEGAQVLSFQEQNGDAMLWALVDPEAPMVFRRFRLAGTGHPIDDKQALQYIGTAQFQHGRLVFHLFEVLV